MTISNLISTLISFFILRYLCFSVFGFGDSASWGIAGGVALLNVIASIAVKGHSEQKKKEEAAATASQEEEEQAK